MEYSTQVSRLNRTATTFTLVIESKSQSKQRVTLFDITSASIESTEYSIGLRQSSINKLKEELFERIYLIKGLKMKCKSHTSGQLESELYFGYLGTTPPIIFKMEDKTNNMQAVPTYAEFVDFKYVLDLSSKVYVDIQPGETLELTLQVVSSTEWKKGFDEPTQSKENEGFKVTTPENISYPIIIHSSKLPSSKEKKLSIFPGPLDPNDEDQNIISAFHGYNRLRASVEARPGCYIVKDMQIIFPSHLLEILYYEITFGQHNNVGYAESYIQCGFNQIKNVRELNSEYSIVTIPMSLPLSYNNVSDPTEFEKKLLSENNPEKRLDSFIDITMHNCSATPIYIVLNMDRKMEVPKDDGKPAITTLDINPK